MKKILLAAALAVALVGCSKDYVKDVQNAKLDVDQSVTIGQAMDRVSLCAKGSQKWTQDGKSSVVEFTCSDNSVKEWLSGLSKLPEFNELKPEQKALFDVKSTTLSVKFNAPVDGKPVSVASVSRTIEWADGVKKPFEAKGETEKQIKNLYANEPQAKVEDAGKLGNLMQLGIWTNLAASIRK